MAAVSCPLYTHSSYAVAQRIMYFSGGGAPFLDGRVLVYEPFFPGAESREGILQMLLAPEGGFAGAPNVEASVGR